MSSQAVGRRWLLVLFLAVSAGWSCSKSTPEIAPAPAVPAAPVSPWKTPVYPNHNMARLGNLMLREGTWLDRQVIPAAWVRESTSPIVTSDRMNPPSVRENRLAYGYLWWVLEEPAGSLLAGSYSARGAYGQYILVAPRLDMVISHKRALRPGDDSSVTWASSSRSPGSWWEQGAPEVIAPSRRTESSSA